MEYVHIVKMVYLSEFEFPPGVKEEIEYFMKAKVPRCFHCKKDFVPGVDSITKKVSKYIWDYDCECVPEDRRGRIMIG